MNCCMKKSLDILKNVFFHVPERKIQSEVAWERVYVLTIAGFTAKSQQSACAPSVWMELCWEQQPPFLHNKWKSRKTPGTNAKDCDQICATFSLSCNCPLFYHYYYNHANGTAQGSYCIREGPQVERLSVRWETRWRSFTPLTLSHCEVNK